MTFHCARCLTSWVGESSRCWSCHRPGERGQLITKLICTHDYSFDGRHSNFSQADADNLVRGDN